MKPFYRSIFLPEGTKTDQIKAEMKHGVLEIQVPVAEIKPNTRQIPVSGTEGTKEPEKKAAAA